ncbi:MAG: phage tail sheath family protein, partial [Acidimicrobiia bacterium]|nr:phage tail sheath family protein [Acidimicrobiia bacterium]
MATYLTPGVYVEEVPSGSATLEAGATAVAAFVGFTAQAPTDDPSDPEGLKPRLVTNWAQFENLYGGFAPGAMLPHAVYGYFNNGGGTCYIVRIPHTVPSEQPSQLALPASDRALGQALSITTKEPTSELSVAITPGPDPEADDEPPTFDVTILRRGEPVESFDGLTLLAGERNAATVINATSTLVDVEQLIEVDAELQAALAASLKPGTYPVLAPAPEPIAVPGRAFSGSESSRTGINGLVIADDVTMVMVPDLITAATKEDGTVDLGMWKSVQTALINHCEGQANRMAILDAPPGMNPQQMKEWRSDIAMYDSAFAA